MRKAEVTELLDGKSKTSNALRIMSWNIGSFIFLKYGTYFGFGSGDSYEYFLPDLNGNVVSETIQNINPDILYLQEFWSPEDVGKIPILKEYPYQLSLDMWYRDGGALIASKKPFTGNSNDFHIITYENHTIIPIHLNSFNPSKRLKDIEKLYELIPNVPPATIVIGDANIWSRGNRFLFSKDKQGYSKLTDRLFNASRNIVSTSYFGFGLDKVFLSGDLIATEVRAPRIRGEFMDHYPIYADVIRNCIFV